MREAVSPDGHVGTERSGSLLKLWTWLDATPSHVIVMWLTYCRWCADRGLKQVSQAMFGRMARWRKERGTVWYLDCELAEGYVGLPPVSGPTLCDRKRGIARESRDEKARMVGCLGAARGSYRRRGWPRNRVAADLLRLPHQLLPILGLQPSAMERHRNRYRHARFCRSLLVREMVGETAINCIERRGCIDR
jgi:hypothetical protein